MSAKTGEGFDALVEFLDQRGEFGQRLMELDYDVYAEGEAELGWLNAQVKFTGTKPVSLDDLLLGIIQRLQAELMKAGAETAHLKTIGLAEGVYGVANLVSSFTPPELSLASQATLAKADLVVNARVAIDPDTLTRLVHASVADACAAAGGKAEFLQTQSFRPGRPVPTHRILA
jgi:hypothetical protein